MNALVSSTKNNFTNSIEFIQSILPEKACFLAPTYLVRAEKVDLENE